MTKSLDTDAGGFVVKRSKVVAPSPDGVDCVGLEVHGRDHTVGLSIQKLVGLCDDTIALLRRHSCTGDELARLMGRWTWACLARRPTYAVFNSVYRFIQCARHRMFSIWSTVRKELRTIVGLVPLLFSSISDDTFHSVICSDASSTGFGMAAARIPKHIRIDTTIHSDYVPGFTYLDGHHVPPPTVPAGSHLCVPCVDSVRIDNVNWRVIASARWRYGDEHINVRELRALHTAVKWCLSSPSSIRTRVRLLCDSQVVVGAVLKGRSSSQPLLRRLRGLAAMVLAGGLRLDVRWIGSICNPADEPSRRMYR